MPLAGEYEPSTAQYVADQVARYESSGGNEGGTMEGKPCVILTTRGRRSEKLRKSPLMRIEHDGTYAVVASRGGGPEHPQWYWNLVSHPEATLQDGAKVIDVRAREANGDEKATWWARAVDVWPPYDEYQAKTERSIPLFILEPVE